MGDGGLARGVGGVVGAVATGTGGPMRASNTFGPAGNGESAQRVNAVWTAGVEVLSGSGSGEEVRGMPVTLGGVLVIVGWWGVGAVEWGLRRVVGLRGGVCGGYGFGCGVGAMKWG